MKANEAPERLYLSKTIYSTYIYQVPDPDDETAVEYTRTDALSMPALDNGNMPVERWKEACEAASCQANYRKSKGLTETCDDYFVDGVQWADEHPKKVKEVDLDKEITDYLEEFIADPTKSYFRQAMLHFFELGLKAQKNEG